MQKLLELVKLELLTLSAHVDSSCASAVRIGYKPVPSMHVMVMLSLFPA